MELLRPRIQTAIVRAARRPVTLVVAAAGTGKTTALRHYLQSTDAAALRFAVRPSHTSLTRFVRGLAATLEPQLPKVPQSLAIAHERAAESAQPADVLATWLAEHLRDTPRTIVIDDYHHCEHDRTIAAFVARVIERTRTNIHWIIAARSAAELPFATWFARGDADLPVDESILRLTDAEAQTLRAELAPTLGPCTVRGLVEATSGSIGPLLFALQTAAGDVAIAERVISAGGNAYQRCVDETLARLTREERLLVTSTASFPDLDPDLVGAAGYERAPERFDGLHVKIPQAFEGHGVSLRYRAQFAEVLRDRLAACGVDAVRHAQALTGRALAGCDRIVESLAYHIQAREFSALARLIDARGLALVEAGYGDVIHEAIQALDPILRTSSSVVLAIKATFESRLGRFDTAEPWFTLALDRATDGPRNQIAYQYATHLLRFQRSEAIAVLEELVRDASVSTDLRCYAQSALGPAYVFARRLDEAGAAADGALGLVRASTNTHLWARVFHQGAYVALYRDDGPRAKTLAAQSLEIAQQHGYFDIAAGALTVLYNVASDLEDDPLESVRVLDAVADCAAKSGSLNNQVLALVAKLEIEVERGAEASIEKLDDSLRTIDIRCCGRAAYEALVASQALRSGWTGDYSGAYHLLLPSAEQQWSDDRKALRWAEIGVYAAAARLTVEATMAIRSSLELLESLGGGHRTTRARLFAALAMILLGRSESAREMFECVDAEPQHLSPRLWALRRALGALAERYRGARNQSALLGLFQTLREQHFGGVARAIMTLPLADNASLLLSELSGRERRLLATLATGDPLVSQRQVEAIVAKLDCIDPRTALRAAARNAAANAAPDQRAQLQEARA